MCFGGGGSGATITMPNTSAYDRQAEMQLDLMRQQRQGVMSLKQMELNQALQGQQSALAELRDFKVQRANETQANAARMAALIGTPPPEKTARAPVVGRDRQGAASPQGKRDLRIERKTATGQAAGTGLNITTS
jgi:hypothetical protein